MRLSPFGRTSRRAAARPGVDPKAVAPGDLDHLAHFAATRDGVEAYLEPRTAVTENTVVLVAATGEWTRRRMGAAAAGRFAKKHSVPLYDVALTGYPPRMRAWTAMRKRTGQIGPPTL